LALLFLAALIGIPLIEIYVFVQVGSEIGAFATILLTIVTTVIGIALTRVQGLGILLRARDALDKRENPVTEMFEGFLLAVAGLFLLIPGFVTDTIGLLLLIPFLRHLLAGAIARRAHVVSAGFYSGPARPRDTVIDGDYEIVEEDPEKIGRSADRDPESPWSREK